MTDRELLDDIELLELAAKAADIYETLHQTEDGFEFIWSYVIWNPLADDGAALRLAVKLHICPAVDETAASAMVSLDEVSWCDLKEVSNDPYAATRRAIVRAAAEIGRRMK